MEVLADLWIYMIKRRPILDVEDKYIFFNNHKVCSVAMRSLERSLSWKHEREEWTEKVKMYAPVDIENMFKFTIVRNPFDRLVSAFFYLRAHKAIKGTMDFKTWIKKVFAKEGIGFNDHLHYQWPQAFYKGNLFLDYVVRYESLIDHWWSVRLATGLPELEKKNVTPHKPWYYHYDEDCADIVREIYKDDFEMFGFDKICR